MKDLPIVTQLKEWHWHLNLRVRFPFSDTVKMDIMGIK